MSTWLGHLVSRVLARDPLEVGVVLVGVVASTYMGGVLLTQDAAPPAERVVVVTGAGAADRIIAHSIGDEVITLPNPTYWRPLTAQVQRSKPSRVVLLGGPDVVGPDMEADLVAAIAAPVTRIAGEDRYTTAAAAATSTFAAPVRRVVIAVSDVSLDGSPVSAPARVGIPVLLVTPSSVPAVTSQALQRLRPQSLTIVGPVSDAVKQQLQTHITGDEEASPAPVI